MLEMNENDKIEFYIKHIEYLNETIKLKNEMINILEQELKELKGE